MSLQLLKLALQDPFSARKKLAYARKKRAAMIKEAPHAKEYSLSKRANLSRTLTDLAYKTGIKAPRFADQASYGILRGTPAVAGAIGGGIGGNLLAREIAPHLGIKGFYGAETLPEILGSLALGTAGTYGGMVAGEKLLDPVGKLVSKKLMPRTARYFKVADPYKLASLDNKRKMLVAASLFPWVSTAAGISYLVNKAKDSKD